MTVGLHADTVSAIVTEVGGATSHSAILARAVGIPAVLSVPKLMEQVQDRVEQDTGVRLEPEVRILEVQKPCAF